MVLFLISIALFFVTFAIFMTMLGLWTYADAKVRTDKPGVWTLIVLLVPNLLGLIIYLLVGRTKTEKSEGRFKKPTIVFAVCFILVSVLMIGSFVKLVIDDNFELPSGFSQGVFLVKVENYWDRQWTVSVKSANGKISKNVNLNETDLESFHVTGNCEDAKTYLTISQGETIKKLDISDSFDEVVDLTEFQPGKVKLVIEFENAKNAKVLVSWR